MSQFAATTLLTMKLRVVLPGVIFFVIRGGSAPRGACGERRRCAIGVCTAVAALPLGAAMTDAARDPPRHC